MYGEVGKLNYGWRRLTSVGTGIVPDSCQLREFRWYLVKRGVDYHHEFGWVRLTASEDQRQLLVVEINCSEEIECFRNLRQFGSVFGRFPTKITYTIFVCSVGTVSMTFFLSRDIVLKYNVGYIT